MNLFFTILILLVSVSLAKADNSTVDVILIENGGAKTTQMTKEEANAKYAPIGQPIRLSFDKEGATTADDYYMEGMKFFQNGEFTKALEVFLMADKLQPGQPNIYNVLAMTYQKTGDNDQALEYFQKALEIQPDSPEYLVNLAFYYYDSGKCDLALPNFKKALSLNPQMNGLSRYIDECSK